MARMLDVVAEAGLASTPPPNMTERDPGYSFSFVQGRHDERPIAYDTCSTIRWVVRRQGEVPGGDDMLQRAFAEVAATTGYRFERGPDRTEPPFDYGFERDASRYGHGSGSPPVLVTWSDEAESPRLAGTWVSGLGGSYHEYHEGVGSGGVTTRHYTSGHVNLDRVDLARWVSSGRSAHAFNLVLHEIGHVLGLDHVDVPGEIMRHGSTAQASFGPGDRRGFEALRSLPCKAAS